MENPIVKQIQRINFLGVPIDILPEKHLEAFILKMLESGKSWKIVLLSYKDFRKARRDKELQTYLFRAGLVIPVDKSLEWGMKALGLPIPVRYHPFDFAIRLFGILEQKRMSLYLLGGSVPEVQKAADTVKTGFPGLVLIGRHAGRYPKETETTIQTAIQKSSPSLLFAGTGLQGRVKWIFYAEKTITSPLVFWSAEAFQIIVGKKRLPPREIFKSRFRQGTLGLAGLWYNPFRWLRIFSYLSYALIVLFSKLFSKKV